MDDAHALAIYDHKVLLIFPDINGEPHYPDSWGFIGGHRKDSEQPEQTIRRVFEEQTSVLPAQLQFLAEIPEAHTNLFLIELSQEEAEKITVGKGYQKLQFFSLSELKELPFYARLVKEYPEYVNLFSNFIS